MEVSMTGSPRILAGALFLLFGSQTARAQSDGAAAGTWAVEGGTFGGGSLLRFRSPSSAMVLGASVFLTRMDVSDFDPATGQLTSTSTTFTSSQLRLGFRHYGDSRNQIRHFSTLSAIVGYNSSGFPSQGALVLGGAGDVGAAYFFTPHVSMGGAGE